MPRLKVPGVVYRECLLDVCHDKVVKLDHETCIRGLLITQIKCNARHTRDFAPEATLSGVRGGRLWRHLTALT